jgi:hypothetical protein
MPTIEEIDAAFVVAQHKSKWSINKIGLVREMLEAAESVRRRGKQPGDTSPTRSASTGASKDQIAGVASGPDGHS